MLSAVYAPQFGGGGITTATGANCAVPDSSTDNAGWQNLLSCLETSCNGDAACMDQEATTYQMLYEESVESEGGADPWAATGNPGGAITTAAGSVPGIPTGTALPGTSYTPSYTPTPGAYASTPSYTPSGYVTPSAAAAPSSLLTTLSSPTVLLAIGGVAVICFGALLMKQKQPARALGRRRRRRS